MIADRAVIGRSLLARGNRSRLVRVMKAALAGEKITVGFIGGSITQGAYASDASRFSYAARVRDWWESTFPNARIDYVNAGVGGTQSILGVHRAQTDLLVHKPDFVIVEFAVNDGADEWQTEAYANLVYRILACDSMPAVLMLFTMNRDGSNTQETEIPVGTYYSLPMISVRDALKPEIESGRIRWDDIGADWVHPNDTGHGIIAGLVTAYLADTLLGIDGIDDADEPLPVPYISEKYAAAHVCDHGNTAPVSLGSFAVRRETERTWLRFTEPWYCEDGSEPILFRVTGSRIFLLYEGGTTGQHRIAVSIDGGEYREITETALDAGSAALYAAYEGDCGTHSVAIKRLSGAFSLKALLVS